MVLLLLLQRCDVRCLTMLVELNNTGSNGVEVLLVQLIQRHSPVVLGSTHGLYWWFRHFTGGAGNDVFDVNVWVRRLIFDHLICRRRHDRSSWCCFGTIANVTATNWDAGYYGHAWCFGDLS